VEPSRERIPGERFRGEGTVVSATIFGIAVVVLVVGCILGWHANRTYAAHGDVKTTRGRIAGYRKTRLRSGVIAVIFVIVALLTVAAVVHA
jgi:hypothetical protein